jgi:hypothetical protein
MFTPNLKVADRDLVMVDGYATLEIKVGDLPKETITAYTFPLGSIDLILGLPWLQKHNPHTDWKNLTFRFTRNGRQYMLWPSKPAPTIRIATPELISPPKKRTPVLESSPVSESPQLSEDGKKYRRKHVQDLSKHRTDAAKKYHAALERLAKSRDNSAYFTTPIISGDLVMRAPLNRKTKMHPNWDGPFVVLDSSDKDYYQLATANGHILENLVNVNRLRKLDNTDNIWEAWRTPSRSPLCAGSRSSSS